MSLPTGGPWPPPAQGVVFAQQAIWSAWLVGDPNVLTTAYTDADAGGLTKENSFAPRTGGVLNRVARYFWSRPSVSGQSKARLHVPLAADIATASADLLFSEPPQFRCEDGNDAGASRVDALCNESGFNAELLEAAELAAALGGVWLRLVWDQDVAERVMVDSVAADAAWGEWRWGLLQAVTFFSEYTEGGNERSIYRHLERHEPGAILHGLYRGSRSDLGDPVPLTDHPATAPYAELVDEEGAIPTGIAGLTAGYVANMRPQRRWRKVDLIANLGRSDYDGVEPLMDALDECYSSWMRDVRLAKARLLVPEDMLTNLGKGQGAAFDQDQEIFTGLNIMQTKETTQAITAQQFSIRVAEHERTAAVLTDEILRAAGYSPSTFGIGGESVATATEVVSRERQSARTRDKKSRYWTQALEPLMTTWLALDAVVFGTGAQGEVDVEWPAATQPDQEALARTTDTLNRAVAVSTDTKVRMLHPDWDEEKIAAEIARIWAEGGIDVPDVGPLPDYETTMPETGE